MRTAALPTLGYALLCIGWFTKSVRGSRTSSLANGILDCLIDSRCSQRPYRCRPPLFQPRSPPTSVNHPGPAPTPQSADGVCPYRELELSSIEQPDGDIRSSGRSLMEARGSENCELWWWVSLKTNSLFPRLGFELKGQICWTILGDWRGTMRPKTTYLCVWALKGTLQDKMKNDDNAVFREHFGII